MPDEQRKLTLITEVDENRIKRSRKRIEELTKSYKDLDLGVSATDEALKRHAGAQYSGIAVTDRYGNVVKDAVRIEQERAAGLKNLEKAQKSANQEVEKAIDLNKEVRTSSQDLIQAKFAASRLGSAVSGLGLPEVGGAISGTGDIAALAGQLPRLVTSAQGAPDAIAKTATALLGIEVSFAAVATAAAPVLVAFAAVSVAYRRFQKQLEESKQNLENAADAQKQYFEIIQTGTRESIQAALEDAQQQQRAAALYLQAQQSLLSQLSQGNIFALLIGSPAVLANISKANVEVNDFQYQINALTEALNSSAVAANTANEAERRRSEQFISDVQRRAEIEQQAADLAREGTSQQFADRLEQLERERSLIERELTALEARSNQTEEIIRQEYELKDRLTELYEEEQTLTDGTLALIRARERETEAIEKTKEVREALADYTEDVANIEDKIADTRSESLRKLALQLDQAERAVEVGLGRANEKAARQLNDRIAKIQRDGDDKVEELRDESAERILDLEEKAARDRERILKNYNRAASNAIRDRDAVALLAAQEARDDQLGENKDRLDQSVEQEKDALDERLDEQEKANKKQLRELQIAHNNELRERRIAANQRLQDLRNENELRRAETIRALDRQLQQELQKRNEAFAKQLTQLGAHNVNLANLNAQGLQQLAQQLQAFYNSQLSSATTGGSSPYTGRGGYGGRPLGSFQTGGIIPRTGLYRMHAGEPVLPSVDALRGLLADQARGRGLTGGAGGGVNLTMAPGAMVVNTRATDARGIARDLEPQMQRMFIKMLKGIAN